LEWAPRITIRDAAKGWARCRAGTAEAAAAPTLTF
jgi:hypothetical protein